MSNTPNNDNVSTRSRSRSRESLSGSYEDESDGTKLKKRDKRRRQAEKERMNREKTAELVKKKLDEINSKSMPVKNVSQSSKMNPSVNLGDNSMIIDGILDRSRMQGELKRKANDDGASKANVEKNVEKKAKGMDEMRSKCAKNVVEKENEANEVREELNELAKMRKISEKLVKYMTTAGKKTFSSANVDFILECSREQEALIQKLALENASMKGKLSECRREKEKLEKERLNRVSDVYDRDVTVGPAESVSAGKGVGVKSSYAVVVRGENVDLSSEEIRSRVMRNVSDVNVRVRNVKAVRGGGVAIETPTLREAQALVANRQLRVAGLRVEETKKLEPRIIVYDVPNEMTESTLKHEMYERNVGDLITRDEFEKRVRVVTRTGKKDSRVANVVIEMPMIVRNKLLIEKRLFVGWQSFRINVYEQVYRCYGCLGYGHKLSECKSERLCYKCGEPGHRAADCRRPDCCRNCKVRNLAFNHSALSPDCPEYKWRLSLMRSRTENG